MSEEMDPKWKCILDELAAVVNRNSLENWSNTPDFVLAKFMAGCLLAWEQGARERDTFYGLQPYPGRSAYAEDAGSKTSRLSARVKVLEEALKKAHALYEAANRSLEDTDEDPEAERETELSQVYTLKGAWARLCDAVDEIDVDGPGFKHLLSTRAGEGGA